MLKFSSVSYSFFALIFCNSVCCRISAVQPLAHRWTTWQVKCSSPTKARPGVQQILITTTVQPSSLPARKAWSWSVCPLSSEIIPSCLPIFNLWIFSSRVPLRCWGCRVASTCLSGRLPSSAQMRLKPVAASSKTHSWISRLISYLFPAKSRWGSAASCSGSSLSGFGNKHIYLRFCRWMDPPGSITSTSAARWRRKAASRARSAWFRVLVQGCPLHRTASAKPWRWTSNTKTRRCWCTTEEEIHAQPVGRHFCPLWHKIIDL